MKRYRGMVLCAATVFTSVVVLACTSGSSSGTTTGGGQGSGSATDFITSYCNVVGPCCGTQGYPSDGSECRTFLTAEEGSATFNGNLASGCLSALQNAANADSTWCMKSEPALDTACKGVFATANTGTAMAGGKCSEDSDCAAGPAGSTVVCNMTSTNGATTSTCQVQIPGKAGSTPCVATIVVEPDGSTFSEGTFSDNSDAGTPSTGFSCSQNDGLYCDSTTNSCLALAAIGAMCNGTNCVLGAYCDFSSQKCAAEVAAGGACMQSTSNQCVSGTYCDMTTNKCTTQLADGAACTTSQSCVSANCNNMVCGSGGNLGLALLCGNK